MDENKEWDNIADMNADIFINVGSESGELDKDDNDDDDDIDDDNDAEGSFGLESTAAAMMSEDVTISAHHINEHRYIFNSPTKSKTKRRRRRREKTNKKNKNKNKN